ncbi:type VI secretion system ImpA family N-terminal domain-containing protein [Endozoicomonas gorgoniicola]|uniref:Type VI secretion system ImpA family N-terminal domain-containing protein n=1 Tax=Endozoicomonas gorgoniicola TaxID=1234144 RepID=A0ABT3MP21_9GAMM|nr:type VI secretion system ImpA family N-terminal domain-containing protein [Endozoicomonas gorgoniicola]MCW7551127.1 type VI secretion system ImpA family N-terminal domain-containing protein [Endozoicomonas gorgoniicola]
MSEELAGVLCSPVSEDHPAGEYLKSNRQLYRPLRNVYNVAQTSLHKLSLNPDPSELEELLIVNQENWSELETMLLDILQTNSRDLECLVWLAMAQLFSDQPYIRLARVLNFLEQVVQTFWPAVQPLLPDEKIHSSDEQGIARERAELQSRPLKLLFGESEDSCQIAVPLRMLPLIGDIDYVRYQRDEAELVKQLQESPSDILNSEDEIVKRINSMQDVIDALDALDKTLQSCFGELNMAAPGSRFFRKQMDANLNAMQNLTNGIIEPWPLDARKALESEQEISEKEATLTVGLSDSDAESGVNGNGSGIDSTLAPGFGRNQAFHQLRSLADFFQKTEPQSPVSYLLEKTIRWGYTPLPDLMHELLQGNEALLGRVTDLTGMNMTAKKSIPGKPEMSLDSILATQEEEMTTGPEIISAPELISTPEPIEPVPTKPSAETEPETTTMPDMTIANLPDSDSDSDSDSGSGSGSGSDVDDDKAQASESADEESSQSEPGSENVVISNLDELF